MKFMKELDTQPFEVPADEPSSQLRGAGALDEIMGVERAQELRDERRQIKDFNTGLAWRRFGHAMVTSPDSIHYRPTRAK